MKLSQQINTEEALVIQSVEQKDTDKENDDGKGDSDSLSIEIGNRPESTLVLK